MTTTPVHVPDQLYAAQHDGRTYLRAQSQDHVIAGDVAAWMRVVADAATDADFSRLIDALPPDREQHARKIRRVLTSYGLFTPRLPRGGKATLESHPLLHTPLTEALRRASAEDLKVTVLARDLGHHANDPIPGPPNQPVAALLCGADRVLILGPVTYEAMQPMLDALLGFEMTPGTPNPVLLRLACTRLARTLQLGHARSWEGIEVTPERSRTLRISPHPQQHGADPNPGHSLDQSVMALIDPTAGRIADLGEHDLPQVPIRISAATDARIGHVVYGFAESFEDARRATVKNLLAAGLPSFVTPGRLRSFPLDAQGGAPDIHTAINSAQSTRPRSTAAQTIHKETPTTPGKLAAILGLDARAAAIGVDTTPEGSLRTALLSATEDLLATQPITLHPVHSHQKRYGRPAQHSPLDQLMEMDSHWDDLVTDADDLIVATVPDAPLPTCVVGQEGIVDLRCGASYREALSRTLQAAVLRRQLINEGRQDLLVPVLGCARPLPTSVDEQPTPQTNNSSAGHAQAHPTELSRELDLEEMTQRLAAMHPGAIAVLLDHDNDLHRAGLVATMVVLP